jgi:hypothetical protein
LQAERGCFALRTIRSASGHPHWLVLWAIDRIFIAGYTVVDGYAVKVVLMSPILLDYYGNFRALDVLAARDTARTEHRRPPLAQAMEIRRGRGHHQSRRLLCSCCMR